MFHDKIANTTYYSHTWKKIETLLDTKKSLFKKLLAKNYSGNNKGNNKTCEFDQLSPFLVLGSNT